MSISKKILKSVMDENIVDCEKVVKDELELRIKGRIDNRYEEIMKNQSKVFRMNERFSEKELKKNNRNTL